MPDVLIMLTFFIFFLTTIFIMWRPSGVNEAIPSIVGASLLLMIGIVPFNDLPSIFRIVSGPAITIIATIMMSYIMEKIGIFRWAAINIVSKAEGSGVKLFVYILLLCFLMTIFFNNDASILITTPIIIHIITILKLKKHQRLPYLFGGVFIATASSLPIGVSNLANLIGLEVVGLDLLSYTNLAFIPSIIGISTLSFLLFLYFRNDIPKKIPIFRGNLISFIGNRNNHPLSELNQSQRSMFDWSLFRVCIVVAVLIRASYFILSPYGIHLEWIAITGATALMFIGSLKKTVNVIEVFKKAPWYILIFAFSMYTIVYAVNYTGLPSIIVEILHEPLTSSFISASLLIGLVITALSTIMNNLPSVMLGTLMITSMDLDLLQLQISYISIIIASDIGALLTPIGTLATLLWMYVLRKNGIHISWSHYIKVAIMVIPITLITTLLSLYMWALFITG